MDLSTWRDEEPLSAKTKKVLKLSTPRTPALIIQEQKYLQQSPTSLVLYVSMCNQYDTENKLDKT